MPVLLWVDVGALLCSALLASTLLLITVGSRTPRLLNISFGLFAGVQSAWSIAGILLKMALLSGDSRAQLFAELAVLFFVLQAPLLLVFTERYLDARTRAPHFGAAACLAVYAGLCPLLFSHRLVMEPRLAANGATVLQVTRLGQLVSILPVALLVWSLALCLRSRRDARSLLPALSLLVCLLGLIAGGLLPAPFLVQAFTGVLSMAMLGYTVLSLQVFNPLKQTAEALRERARRLELLAGIGQQTTAIRELDEMLHQAIALIREQFSYFNVSILLVDGPELVLRAAAAEPLRRLENRLRLKVGGEGITGWVAGSGQPLLVPDVSREPRYLKGDPQVLTRSELAVPIKLKGEVIGVLDAQSAEPDGFAPIDSYTLQTVADQLAITIDNARLYAETRRRAERLAVVTRVSAAVGASLRLDELLAAVYREVAPIFQTDAFFIALYDEPAEELDFRFQVDEGKVEAPDRQPLGSGLSSLVVKNRQPLLIRDFEQERARLPVPSMWGSMKLPPSWLGVPMRLGERVTGVICVQAYRPRAYTEEDQLLLLTIADQVAVAVENAHLFEASQAELAERKLTEEVLRESEEKFRNLAEQSPNMIFINRGGRVVYANRLCEELKGYTREQMYSPSFDFLSLIAPEDHAKIRTQFVRHQRGEDLQPYEYTLLARDGRRIEVILASRLLRYGGETSILGIVTDIAVRKRTERMLAALNAAGLAMERVLRPAEIFPTAGRELAKVGLRIVIFLTDESGERLRAEYLGYDSQVLDSAGELLGLKADDFTIPIDQVETVRLVMRERRTRLLEGREAVEEKLPPAFKPLAPRLVEHLQVLRAFNAPLVVEDNVIGLLSVQSPDLTEEDIPAITAFANQIAAAWRKARLVQDLENSLRELKRAQGELIQAQKMEAIGRLAGGIAHDFNNVLTAIGGYTQLLLDRFPEEGPVRADLAEIKKATSKAGGLTRQLLAFSRKQLLQPKVLDLNEVVVNMEAMLRRLLGEHIELSIALAPGLGPVKADPLQLEQVIMNLAINAADAMPKGGKLTLETSNVELQERLGLQSAEIQPGAYVLLAVSDTGVGMDADTQSRLFEPFFTTKEQGKGTGLGLSTVYGIVTQSGGQIHVYSRPGYGTTFQVFLPRVREQAAAPVVPSAPAVAAKAGETILLVEDELPVRDLIRRVLSGLGYTVLEASSAVEALAAWRAAPAPIHLLLTDVVMPGGMDGRELAERLAVQSPGLRVLFISGYTPGAAAHRGLLPAGGHFLQKPFSPAALGRKVREVLG